MTANELRKHFSDTFAFGDWPLTYEVDHETYANCCQAVFDWVNEGLNRTVMVGIMNNGLLFKNVELILKDYKK